MSTPRCSFVFFLMFDLKRWRVNILFSSSEVLNVRIPIFSFLLLLFRVNLKQELLFLFWEKRLEFSAVGGHEKFTNVKVLSHAFRLCQFVQRWWVKSVRRNGRIEEKDIDWEIVAELEKKRTTCLLILIWFKMDAGGQPVGHHDIVPRLIEGSLRAKAVRLFFRNLFVYQ